MAFLRKVFDWHTLIITVLTFVFIWIFQVFFFSRHFLDPFNNGLRDYEVTDIVYSQFRDPHLAPLVGDIILVNTGAFPDRVFLANLLDQLKKLEPRVIGLDVELDGRKDPAVDSTLKAAIDRIPNIVLASRLIASDSSSHIFASPAYCDPYFSKGKTRAFTNFVSEDTSIIRFFSPREMTAEGEFLAFPVEVVRQYAPDKVEALFRRQNPVERIWYTGNQSFVKIEADQVLEDSFFQDILKQENLKNRIILVGYVGEHRRGEPESDRFFTPLNPRYSGKSYPDMYGLEIHANIATMILQSKYIFQLPKWMEELAGWLFCYFNVLIFHWIYIHVHSTFHGITRLIQLVELMALFFLIALFFYYFRIQINLADGILAMLLSYDVIMIYESLIKKKIKFLQKL
ncbi:MAG: CHASE2 domain-containing protein [Lewinellaceae bacterium]|nr:CHASE2 domain-containing protein [Lewinellaceae bacterium]